VRSFVEIDRVLQSEDALISVRYVTEDDKDALVPPLMADLLAIAFALVYD